MTPSPDLIHELRASRPSAPADLRNRVRAIVSSAAAPRLRGRTGDSRYAAECSSPCPQPRQLALASAGVLGLARSDSPQALRQAAPAPVEDATTAESAAPRRSRCNTGTARMEPARQLDSAGPARPARSAHR